MPIPSVLQVLQGLESQAIEFLWMPQWDHSPQSILALQPLAVWQVERNFQWSDFQKWMQECASNFPPNAQPGDATQGGFFGGLSYEASLGVDRIRHAQARSLLGTQARFGFYPLVYVYDSTVHSWTLSGPLEQYPAYAQSLRDIFQSLPQVTCLPHVAPQWTQLVPPASYCEWVQQARQAIAQGDIYQANLAHPLLIEGNENLPQLFQRIHSHNPSPWAAYWNTPHFQLLSNSPELLLENRHGTLRAKPIAGTRPRGTDEQSDSKIRRNLIRSPKERAEHLMLVDLVRNDLGKVCQAGSVHVPLLLDREPYRNVTHIVSTIQGQLQPHITASAALAAAFPGGTITGTPKLRSMEIIDQLETHPRGFYTGSLGWIHPAGDFAWNILIRTLQVQKTSSDFWKAYLHVGAGIVADSNPQREFQETLHKAAAWRSILQ